MPVGYPGGVISQAVGSTSLKLEGQGAARDKRLEVIRKQATVATMKIDHPEKVSRVRGAEEGTLGVCRNRSI